MAKSQLFSYAMMIFLGLSSASFGAEQNAEAQDPFGRGVQAFQAKNYENAATEFQNALQKDPTNPDILVNLAHSLAKAGKSGHAIAFFSQALVLDPGHPGALAGKEYLVSQLAVKELPHRIEFIESIKSDVLAGIHPFVLFLLTFGLLGATGFLWTHWFVAKKSAEQKSESLPPIRTSLVLLSLIAFVFLGLAAIQVHELSIARAITLPEKMNVLSGPSESAVELFEITWGLEVKVLKIQNDWAQIAYPGGSSGWVKSDSIYIFKGAP